MNKIEKRIEKRLEEYDLLMKESDEFIDYREFLKESMEMMVEHNASILDDCFSVVLNANDTFGYCCADSHEVELIGLCVLEHIYNLYGFDGITALMAYEREEEPIKERITNEYKLALAEIDVYLLKTGLDKCYKRELERKNEQ